MIVIDIETGPLPLNQLKAICPPFDESEIKCGNLKDPEKIAAKIDEARRTHFDDFAKRAALSATTGEVLAIGYFNPATNGLFIDGAEASDEPQLLDNFWRKYRECRQRNVKIVGHNLASFDVPFIARRSLILDVGIPDSLLEKGRWLDSIFVDTMSIWGFGGREPIKLDLLGQCLGLGRKCEGIAGADFHKFWRGTVEERHLAIQYLNQDLRLTAAIAERMGIQ